MDSEQKIFEIIYKHNIKINDHFVKTRGKLSEEKVKGLRIINQKTVDEILRFINGQEHNSKLPG